MKQQSSRLEWPLVALALFGAAVPSLESGTSALELLAFLASILSAAYLALGPFPRVRPRGVFWLLPCLLLWAHLSLQHEEPRHFLTYVTGIYVFVFVTYAGASSTPERRRAFSSLLLPYLILAVTTELVLDLSGWTQINDSGYRARAWELGSRGINAAQSGNGVLLAIAAAWALLRGPGLVVRLVAVLGLVAAFYHVVVIGQSRGSTLTAVLGVALVMASSKRLVLGPLLIVVPVLILLDFGVLEPLLEPIQNRADVQTVGEIDRIQHVELSLRFIATMDPVELFVGIPHERVWAANEAAGIHNAVMDIAVSYGLPAAALFLAFWVGLAVVVARELLNPSFPESERLHPILATTWLLASLAAGVFWNWRACVVPAFAIGFSIASSYLPQEPRYS